MDVTSITDIERILNNRLSSTKSIHRKVIESGVDDTLIEKNIFINYYLDFSTGIEFVIRQILLKKYGSDEFISDKIKIKSEKNPMFYEYPDVEKMIKGAFPYIKWIDFKSFSSSACYDVKQNDYQNHPDDYIVSIDDFKNAYSTARTNRNSLAHGFEGLKVVYSKKTMLLFALAYYVLFRFYENM